MKPICRELQERLADEGAQALRDDVAAQRHLEECPDCFRVLEGLSRLDDALLALAAVDAPEPVVSELLERVRNEGHTPAIETVRRPRLPRSLVWGFASAAVVMLGVGVMMHSMVRPRMAPAPAQFEGYLSDRSDVPATPPTTIVPEPEGQLKKERAGEYAKDGDFERRILEGLRSHANERRQYLEKNDELARNGALRTEEVDKLRGLGYVGSVGDRAAAVGGEDQVGQKTLSVDGSIETGTGRFKQKADAGKAGADDKRRAENADGEKPQAAAGDKGQITYDFDSSPSPRPVTETKSLVTTVDDFNTRNAGRLGAIPRLTHRIEPTYPEGARSARLEGVVILELKIAASGRVESARVLRSVPLLDAAALEAVKQWVYAPTVVNGKAVPVTWNVSVTFRLSQPTPTKEPGSSDNSTDPARVFLAERSATEGLAFQPTNGYWANTYVPGDPALRLLQARLAAWDRSALQARKGSPLRLHDAAVQASQPFDAPRDGALAVYLHSDRASLEGPGRMLVQVGLKGAARAGGRRPAMNVALVLDLRGKTSLEMATAQRALALALARAREAGDRFSLVVAGRPGGVVVAPAEFKHGPLTVALERLLSNEARDGGLGLADALAAAYREVARCDDPEAPLGSSAVVLATGQGLEETGTLADLAHQGAVAGIPLSVIAVGGGVRLDEIDSLVLAGQGRRGALDAPADAARLVDSELSAAGNAVARAVRLRIRLAPGVKLIEMVGSRRLDEAQAERVRQAERSIDLDLSRKLGIESDRGADEDGIQVLIPSFQAGDAHAILLDVVADGPGPIVDVAVRYKDVLSLGNGVARTSLSLPRGAVAPGPLERNVLANLLAFRTSRTLACAGDALAAGDASGAAAQIAQARTLLAGLGTLVPAFAAEPGLTRDAAMLREYAELLASGAIGESERPQVADSLRYAARLMLLTRPAPLTVAAL